MSSLFYDINIIYRVADHHFEQDYALNLFVYNIFLVFINFDVVSLIVHFVKTRQTVTIEIFKLAP
jgi:hypothetical protein